MITVPFSRSGSQAAGDVLAQRGRTYLLSVVAQVGIDVQTTDSLEVQRKVRHILSLGRLSRKSGSTRRCSSPDPEFTAIRYFALDGSDYPTHQA